MASRIQVRRDTADNWTTINPVLAEGELALELDTGFVKFGDGVTPWIDLSYFSGDGFDPDDLANVARTGQWADIANRPVFSPVATSGQYAHLTGTPTIPSTPQEVGADPAGTAAGLVGGLAPVATTGDYGDLGNTPTLGTAAAANTGDFASAAQGQTADTALQPDDLSATGLATYDDQTGVIDVLASAVESLVDAKVNALPELADSLSTAVDSSTPGLVTVNVVHHTFGASWFHDSTTETTLNTSTPEIPGGTLDIGSGLVDFEVTGEVNNSVDWPSGSPVTFTVRLKASQGGSTVSTWTIPATLEANGKAQYSLSGSAEVVDFLGLGVQKHLTGPARVSASFADLTPVVNGVVAPVTVQMDPSLPITWSVTGEMTVAAAGTNVFLHRGSIRYLA